mgnify:CR=1 FL=1
MAGWLQIVLIGTSIALIVKMWRDHNRGRLGLISIRNVFLLGFIHFQLLSVALWLAGSESYRDRWVIRPLRELVDRGSNTSMWFVIWALLFLTFYMLAYHRSRWITRLAKKVPAPQAMPLDSRLLFISAIGTLIAITCWYLQLLPIVGPLLRFVGAGVGAVSCGLAGWVWARRLWNLPMLAYTFGLVLANILPMMMGQIGRRQMLSMAAAVVWGVFFRRLYATRSGKLVVGTILLAILPLMLLGMFSEVRGARPTSFNDLTALLGNADMLRGTTTMLYPQDSGPASLWVMEYYPERFEYRHLHSPKAFVIYFIPRDFWPEKPSSLGILVPDQAEIRGRGNLNIGPGLIGQAMAEGGWYALIIYALLLGWATRWLDQVAILNFRNPFVLMPIGAALGDTFALARGELSFFADIIFMSVFGSMIVVFILAKMAGSFTPDWAIRLAQSPPTPNASVRWPSH